MASLTINLDVELLQAAKAEAERRHTSVDQLIADYVSGFVKGSPSSADNDALIRLMYEGRVGHLNGPLSREEIYAERKWPRS
jgi:hypothetical protein